MDNIRRPDEMIRIRIDREPDHTPLLLTDYAACGKHWNREKNRVTVWMRRSTGAEPGGDGRSAG